jgi:transmembrane sensor
MTAPQRLAQFIQPNLHEPRLAHQWARIENSSRHRSKFAFAWFAPVLAASLFLCGALFVGWHWLRAPHSLALNGTVVESSESGSELLTLPDGSRIELGSASRVVVDTYEANKVQVTLKRGSAEFDVAHQSGRRFAVLAGSFEISVLGTHFSVSLGAASEPGQVTVQVARGKVSVRNRQSAPDERVLAAGQTWSAAEQTRPSTVLDAAGSNSGAAAKTESAEEQELARIPPSAPKGSAATTLGSGDESSATEAKDLFEAAQLSRINGNLRQSADSLNKLRKSYRSDPRASLAAFELGRMRMDIFGDATGSIDAFRDAIKLSPNATFREDAEARLVQLYHRQGDRRCEAAKAQYLERYPNGAARKLVSRLCVP